MTSCATLCQEVRRTSATSASPSTWQLPKSGCPRVVPGCPRTYRVFGWQGRNSGNQNFSRHPTIVYKPLSLCVSGISRLLLLPMMPCLHNTTEGLMTWICSPLPFQRPRATVGHFGIERGCSPTAYPSVGFPRRHSLFNRQGHGSRCSEPPYQAPSAVCGNNPFGVGAVG